MSAVGDDEDESDVMFGLARSSAVGGDFGTGDVPSCVCEAGSWTNVSHPGLLPFLFFICLHRYSHLFHGFRLVHFRMYVSMNI